MTEDSDSVPATEHGDLQRFTCRATSDIRMRDQRVTGWKAGGLSRLNRQQNTAICRVFSTGATGLEPATSGVTGVCKPFQRVSSSRRNRVTVGLFRMGTLRGLPQFFVRFHPVVSMTFPG